MADISIRYDEDMVGAGHPTKDDTLSRLFKAGGARADDGRVNYLVMTAQAAAPSTGASELALYAMDDGGELALYVRGASDGASQRLA